MSHALRLHSKTYLTAGIATLGAGAMALSAVQPTPSQVAPLQQRVVSDLAVSLAAAVDPIQAWVNTFETSVANIQTLGKLNAQNPFPLLKTVGANVATYAEELGNGQGNLIPGQIWNNVQTFFQAPWDPGSGNVIPYSGGPQFVATGDYASGYVPPDGQSPATVISFVALSAFNEFFNGCDTDDSCSYKAVLPVTNFLATPYSGQLVALIGTLISPVVQLVKSFTAIGQYFQEGKALDAIYELINIPANTTNAALNGAGFLDLTGIVSAIVPDSPLAKVGINLGGLLNVMPQNGSAVVDIPPSEWSGGVGIDSLSVGEPGAFDYAPGLPNGLFGANIGLGQFLADKLLVTPPEPEEAAAAPAPAAAVVEDDSESALAGVDVVEAEATVEVSDPAPKATAETGGASDDGNTGRAARSGRGAR